MIGQTISHYRVLDRIGAGGMGEVYRAHDPRLNREVALKVLPSSFSREPDRLARFEREARAAGALNHPNILAIYDVGSQDGVPYIVSELLEGETLRDRMASGTLTVRKAVDLAAQVAEGLAAAHGKGIVHRDLKPDNIFITREGHAKILDFGLAKLTQREASSNDGTAAPTTTMLTEAGTVVGTVSYMSPEQLLGATLDHRSDVFSFGVVLYEMLSHRRPFDGDSRAQVIASILRDEPAPLSDPQYPVPGALDRVVRQCLEKRPEERFESAHDLAFTLRAVSESMSSAPAITVQRRSPTVLLTPLAVVAVIAVATVAVWWGVTRYRGPALPEHTRIVVLPFEVVDEDPDHALLAAGLTDTVSDELLLLEQQTGGRMWVARRPAADTLDQAWRLDNVTLGLGGRLRFQEDRVWFELTLLAAENGRRLRREVIEDQVSNLSCLQREPIVRIAEMLGLPLDPGTESRLEAATTIVQGACMLCLRGRGMLSGSTGIADVEAAIETLEDAVEQDPGYGLARIAIARASRLAYIDTRDAAWVERGLEQTQRIIDQGGLELPGYLEQGRLLVAADRLDEAVASLTAATRVADWSADAFFALGFAHEAAAQFEQAEAAYQAGINRRPDDVWGYSWLGFLYWTTSEPDAAANQFRRMTEVAPNNPEGYNNYGGVLATMGRREEALEVFQRSLEVDPDNGVAYSQLGTLHFLESRFGSAAEMLERAVELAPDDFDLLVNLAAAYYWGGQRERAAEVYRRAIEVGEARLESGDDRPVLMTRLASCHAMVGGRDRALTLLDEVIARLPPQAQVMGMVAEAYEDLGERERALEWIERALDNGLPADWVDERPALSRLKEDAGFRSYLEDRDTS